MMYESCCHEISCLNFKGFLFKPQRDICTIQCDPVVDISPAQCEAVRQRYQLDNFMTKFRKAQQAAYLLRKKTGQKHHKRFEYRLTLIYWWFCYKFLSKNRTTFMMTKDMLIHDLKERTGYIVGKQTMGRYLNWFREQKLIHTDRTSRKMLRFALLNPNRLREKMNELDALIKKHMPKPIWWCGDKVDTTATNLTELNLKSVLKPSLRSERRSLSEDFGDTGPPNTWDNHQVREQELWEAAKVGMERVFEKYASTEVLSELYTNMRNRDSKEYIKHPIAYATQCAKNLWSDYQPTAHKPREREMLPEAPPRPQKATRGRFDDEIERMCKDMSLEAVKSPSEASKKQAADDAKAMIASFIKRV